MRRVVGNASHILVLCIPLLRLHFFVSDMRMEALAPPHRMPPPIRLRMTTTTTKMRQQLCFASLKRLSGSEQKRRRGKNASAPRCSKQPAKRKSRWATPCSTSRMPCEEGSRAVQALQQAKALEALASSGAGMTTSSSRTRLREQMAATRVASSMTSPVRAAALPVGQHIVAAVLCISLTRFTFALPLTGSEFHKRFMQRYVK